MPALPSTLCTWLGHSIEEPVWSPSHEEQELMYRVKRLVAMLAPESTATLMSLSCIDAERLGLCAAISGSLHSVSVPAKMPASAQFVIFRL